MADEPSLVWELTRYAHYEMTDAGQIRAWLVLSDGTILAGFGPTSTAAQRDLAAIVGAWALGRAT